MGYAMELFIDKNVNEEFICPICQDVVKDVTMISNCEHIFCKSCIDEWKQTSSTCPVDRENIRSLKKPQRVFMNLLNSLELRCNFSSTGCKVITKLGDMKDHDERCDFNPENNKECVGQCGAIVKKCEIKNHSCVVYLKELLRLKDEELEKYKSAGQGQGITVPLPTTISDEPAAKRYRSNGKSQSVTSSRTNSLSTQASSSSSNSGSSISQPRPHISYTNRKNITQPNYDKIINIVTDEIIAGGFDGSVSSILTNRGILYGLIDKLKSQGLGEWKTEMYEKINLVDFVRVTKSISTGNVSSRLDLHVNGVNIHLWKL